MTATIHQLYPSAHETRVKAEAIKSELYHMIETQVAVQAMFVRERMRACDADMKAAGLPQKFNCDH